MLYYLFIIFKLHNSTELITYLKLLKVNTIQCPLEFWKTHEKTLPILAVFCKLKKKLL